MTSNFAVRLKRQGLDALPTSRSCAALAWTFYVTCASEPTDRNDELTLETTLSHSHCEQLGSVPAQLNS